MLVRGWRRRRIIVRRWLKDGVSGWRGAIEEGRGRLDLQTMMSGKLAAAEYLALLPPALDGV
jgi:hypothetical protein